MRFEIINPSDPYTMEAPDLEVAAVAVSFLGNGKYPLKALGEDAGDANDVPPFLFGGHDEWFTSKFGMNYEDTAKHCLEHRADELARAFDSVHLESKERSSMNNIGGRAKSYADAVRRSVFEARLASLTSSGDHL